MSNPQWPAMPQTIRNPGPVTLQTRYGELPPHSEMSLPGLTVRQYYAAHSGITLDDANVSLQLRNTMGVEVFGPAVLIPEMIRLRLEYADAMIAAESAQ